MTTEFGRWDLRKGPKLSGSLFQKNIFHDFWCLLGFWRSAFDSESRDIPELELERVLGHQGQELWRSGSRSAGALLVGPKWILVAKDW